MTVVADASPLIALARIGRLDLLRTVFGGLLLPDAATVVDDLRRKAGFWLSNELRLMVVGSERC